MGKLQSWRGAQRASRFTIELKRAIHKNGSVNIIGYSNHKVIEPECRLFCPDFEFV